MIKSLKSYFKRDMQSPKNPEVLDTPNIRTNTGFESFPPRFDDGERTLTCPTCGGSGRLTQEHENDLVALIPVRDNRLKSRAKVYILIAVLAIALVAGVLLAVFLFPRNIYLKLADSNAFNITLAPANGTVASMLLNNTIHISNDNFFDITVKKVNQQVTWGGSNIVADKTFEGQQLVVPAKSSIVHQFIVKLVYDGKPLCAKMKKACCWFDKMLFIIVTQGKVDGVTVSQEISHKSYEYVKCLFYDPDWSTKCRFPF